jgi:hypothetical protein
LYVAYQCVPTLGILYNSLSTIITIPRGYLSLIYLGRYTRINR